VQGRGCSAAERNRNFIAKLKRAEEIYSLDYRGELGKRGGKGRSFMSGRKNAKKKEAGRKEKRLSAAGKRKKGGKWKTSLRKRRVR